VSYEVENIVLPGPVRVLIAPWVSGTIEAPPANSVAYGDDWGGDWVDVGATQGGAVMKVAEETYSVTIDQQKQPVADRKISEVATVEAVLVEATLANIKKAMGLGTITVGSTVTSFGSDGDETLPTYLTIGLEHYGPGSIAGEPKYRRTFIWKAMPKPSVELKSAPNEEQRVASVFEARREADAPEGYKKLYHIEDLN
jgi:hypothetical protein